MTADKYRDFAEKCKNPPKNYADACVLLDAAGTVIDKLLDSRQANLLTEAAKLAANNTANISVLIEQGIILSERVDMLAEQVGKLTAGEKSAVKKNEKSKTVKKFTPPPVEEVAEYCKERGNKVDPQHWYDYYLTRGWVLSNGKKMVDWKAAVRTWESKKFGAPSAPPKAETGDGKHNFNPELLMEHALTHTPTGIDENGKTIYG